MARASDARVALLREILLGEEVPHHPDDYLAPPADVVEAVPTPTVTLTAVGGRSVVVDEGQLRALFNAAGVAPSPDIARIDYGRLLTQAKGGHPLMAALLTARCNFAPLYRVRTAEGRPWRPTTTPITP